jgi:phage tail sheath gpL-like
MRYLPPVQAGFRTFTAHRGDYAAAAAFGETKNYEHISDLSLEINPTTPWEAAAIVTAAAAPKLYNNPVESLEGIALPGMIGLSYHDWTNANSLLFKGMSVMQVAKDGSCSIKRLISMYQYRADGSADDAFLDINAAEAMERIRYEQRIGAIKKFVGTAAAKNNEGYRPGLRITTEDDVRAYLLSLYQHWLMREKGWVQAYDYYKETLVVEQDATNPSRFNFKDDPVLLSPFYILAGRSQFRKAVPVY